MCTVYHSADLLVSTYTIPLQYLAILDSIEHHGLPALPLPWLGQGGVPLFISLTGSLPSAQVGAEPSEQTLAPENRLVQYQYKGIRSWC